MDLFITDVHCYISTARHDKSHNDIVIIMQSFYDYEKIIEAKDIIYEICNKKIIRKKVADKISKKLAIF